MGVRDEGRIGFAKLGDQRLFLNGLGDQPGEELQNLFAALAQRLSGRAGGTERSVK